MVQKKNVKEKKTPKLFRLSDHTLAQMDFLMNQLSLSDRTAALRYAIHLAARKSGWTRITI